MVLSSSAISAQTIENEDSNRVIYNNYFDKYQTTLRDGREYMVELTSNVTIDFFILDTTNTDLYEDIVKGRETTKTFDDVDILFDSYKENINSHSFSFTVDDAIDARFIVGNTDNWWICQFSS